MKQNTQNQTIDKLFIPQRTQPPHRGHVSMLESACRMADEVVIGIGSANKYDAKNPYTADERQMMLDYSLQQRGVSNYRFIQVPDFETDSDWIDYVTEYAEMDENSKVVSGNPWVDQIFGERGYETIDSFELASEKIDISATRLRGMIVDNDPQWREYAASGTLHYFENFGGADRIARFYQDKAA
ncbi:adenylyltransferase/cytidyltransferase family protein [Nanoarchaeota archaeon]